MIKTPKVRYQASPWYVRLWRRLEYLWVPGEAVGYYVQAVIDEEDGVTARVVDVPPCEQFPNGTKFTVHGPSWQDCWSLARSCAQVRMGWTYTLEEVEAALNLKDNPHV